MTEAVLRSTAEITPGWLTEILRRYGVLGSDGVAAVAVESQRATLLAHTVRLRLSYASVPPVAAPARLFLKMTKDELDLNLAQPIGRGEVSFYRAVAPAMSDPPAPRCYDAVFDEALGRFHLLLEDLSETHHVLTQWPLPPTVEQCQHIVETYARFHAAWWDDPRLGNGIGTPVDPDRYVAHFTEAFARFADFLGDRLSKERRERYERVLAASARLAGRRLTGKNVTLAHGDAHIWNLLYPREGTGGTIRLIDWENWRPGIAARDLAYMMAVHWYPERRRRFEVGLLRHYHRVLENYGVRGYSLNALWQDYRLAVIGQLALPVFQAASKIGPWIWWGHLERVMLAFEDLKCDEILSLYLE